MMGEGQRGRFPFTSNGDKPLAGSRPADRCHLGVPSNGRCEMSFTSPTFDRASRL
jgi:hypothetical protein